MKLMHLLLACVLLHVGAHPTSAQQEQAAEDWSQTPVLTEQMAGGPPQLMLHRWLMRQLKDADQGVAANAAQIDSLESLADWQKRTRTQLIESLGGFPERTPLNPVITGEVHRELYDVQKILFESRPQHFVTAALFLPSRQHFPPPWPAILIPCGHSAQGKGIAAYQRGAVLAAANGMAAMIYDPIDQGERIQLLDASGKPMASGTGGHNQIGISAMLLGWNTATFRIWDGMRALDYLVSRPDIDGDRVGCMGNSGGGTLTTFLTAIDDRIRVSAPSCYVTSLSMVCETIGPQDAEQNIFGQMGYGLDHAEFLMLRMPVPVCICAATQDFFPIEGARQAFSRLNHVARRLGMEDRLTMVENEGPHGWAEPLRVGANRWMNRWLREQDDLQIPPETETGISESEILVTSTGQVMQLSGARSVYDLMREERQRLEQQRRDSQSQPRTSLRERVRARAGIRELQHIPAARADEREDVKQSWGTVRRMTLQWREDLLLPAFLYLPAQRSGEAVLIVHGSGKPAARAEAERLAQEGCVVFVPDLTGFGETQGSLKEFYGSGRRDEPAAMTAALLGLSLTGMRAEDILAASRWLATAQNVPAVRLSAVGWAVTPALHAAAAEPQLFSRVTLAERPDDWNTVIEQGLRHRFSDVVHGALRDYDLSDLQNAAPALELR